jgi:TolA-binding protein
LIRFLVRVVLAVVVLSLLVLALYFGLPLLNQRYVVPVEQNTSDLAQMQSRQEQTQKDLSDLQASVQSLERIQNQQDGSLTKLDERLSEIESDVAARTQSLEALEQVQSELEAQNEAASEELERQIHLLKSMELLSRARLFMYQSNFGLARQDVHIARDLLATVQADAPAPLDAELEAVILRLDMTIANLPDFPVAASDDLDIAWQILLSGIPEPTPAVTATATSPSSASPTPGSGSATITPTLQPSATP